MLCKNVIVIPLPCKVSTGAHSKLTAKLQPAYNKAKSGTYSGGGGGLVPHLLEFEKKVYSEILRTHYPYFIFLGRKGVITFISGDHPPA